MNLAITILRWIVAIPAALIGSDFCGMLLAPTTHGIRHLGGKIFGDVIDDLLQKPFAIIDNFIIGVLFVLIGAWIAPLHNLVVIIGFAAVKAWVDYQRNPGSFQSVASTSGAILTAIVLSYLR